MGLQVLPCPSKVLWAAPIMMQLPTHTTTQPMFGEGCILLITRVTDLDTIYKCAIFAITGL